MSLLAEQWTKASRRIAALPAPGSYVDFCKSVILPDGRGKDQAYNPATHPAQLTVLQALDGGTYFAPKPFTEAAIAKPVQDGGSLVAMVPLFRRAFRQRQTVVVAFPTMDSAKDQWTLKLLPVLQSYGGQEPESGGGSRGGAARVVTLPDGGKFVLRTAGGKGESGQASITADALGIDEVEDWEDAHKIKLITKRIEESPDPLTLYVCTVKRKLPEASIILTLVAGGTDTRLWYCCPDCGFYQRLTWDNVRYERRDNEVVGGTSRYLCANPHCGSLWVESARKAAIRKYLVVHRGQEIQHERNGDRVTGAGIAGPIPDTLRFSLLWNRIESPRKSLETLCRQHADAEWNLLRNREHGPMRSFYQDYLTQQYVGEEAAEDGAPAKISCDVLAARSETSDYGPPRDLHEEGGDSIHTTECPTAVDWLVVSADIQRGGQNAPGRAYFYVTGFNTTDFRSFDLCWGHIVMAPAGREPTVSELHAGLDRLSGLVRDLAQTYAKPMVRRGIDVGDRQDELRLWLIKNAEWIALKGAAAEMKADMKASSGYDVAGIIYRRQQQERGVRWWLHFIDTDSARREAQAAFLVPAGKPGAAHLPKGLDRQTTIIKHLCATAEISDGKGGARWASSQKDRKYHPDWQSRHDLLDTRHMNVAMARQYAKELARAPKPEDRPQFEAPSRNSGFVSDFVQGGWSL